ncbi:hypothetical protein Dvul_1714 [Nitratidesulfovibrio vulgaris DP4]|uniref:Uncharacterized protein n=1 Tax=Nitratidesulfovibrio vulgaris (strain DP4) TaxID=391774 RepID=A0A0H3A849_NITV4|nr:hypothetical protein Dvul_1714 [Nitratidesulfovibrio vulgaris DP4]
MPSQNRLAPAWRSRVESLRHGPASISRACPRIMPRIMSGTFVLHMVAVMPDALRGAAVRGTGLRAPSWRTRNARLAGCCFICRPLARRSRDEPTLQGVKRALARVDRLHRHHVIS